MIAKSRGQVVKFAMRRSGVRIIASKPVRTGKALHPTMIEVEPEIAIKIQARARERGVSVAVYLRELIDHKGTESESSNRLSSQERVRLLREWASAHRTNSPLLSDDAISREGIYGERP